MPSETPRMPTSMSLAESKERLAAIIQEDGSLRSIGWYLNYDTGDSLVTLDGAFGPEDLMAIAVYVKGHANAK